MKHQVLTLCNNCMQANPPVKVRTIQWCDCSTHYVASAQKRCCMDHKPQIEHTHASLIMKYNKSYAIIYIYKNTSTVRL